MKIKEKVNNAVSIIRDRIFKKNKNDNSILMEIAKVQDQLVHAQLLFDTQTNLDLIESCIYQIESLEVKYNYLIKEARAKGLKQNINNLCLANWLGWYKVWTFITTLFIFVTMLTCYMRCKNIWKVILFGPGSGILSLYAIGIFTTDILSFNIFTIFISTVAGIPGVITSILLNKFIL